jgi:hypothetical protein
LKVLAGNAAGAVNPAKVTGNGQRLERKQCSDGLPLDGSLAVGRGTGGFYAAGVDIDV